MGIFQSMVEVVNRTSGVLSVRFDGQDMDIPPNYDEKGARIPDVVNVVPKLVIPYLLNQNVIMGSESALDPSSFRSKVGIPSAKMKSWQDCSYVPSGNEEITRVSQAEIMDELVSDPKAKLVTRGKVVPSSAAAALGVDTKPFDLRK